MIPTLKKNTFISMKAWNNLRIMSPIEDNAMSRVCDRLPDFHILANLDFQPLKTVAKVSYGKQLLQCLLKIPKDKLENLFRERLDDADLKVQTPKVAD